MAEIRQKYPDKTIWLYTGDVWENVRHDATMQYVDVLVDGEFEVERRDTRLLWKGSGNQRVIDVKRSLELPEGEEPVLFLSIVFHPRLVGGSVESIFWQGYVQPLLSDASCRCVCFDPQVPWQRQALSAMEEAVRGCPPFREESSSQAASSAVRFVRDWVRMFSSSRFNLLVSKMLASPVSRRLR